MQVETMEKNKIKLTFEVGPERFEEGLKYAYNKNKGSFVISGFRKGKVPRKMIEAQYGREVFFEEAINYVMRDAYADAIKERQLDVVSKAEIDIESVSVGEGVVFTAEVFVKPEVSISNYLGVTYTKASAAVTEDEINTEINRDREKNARVISVSDRPAKEGDIVTIDFKGFIGGEPFNGGSADDYDLELGGGKFIPGFEAQIEGHTIGEQINVNVTFPEDYHDETARGQAAVFEVEIKEIKFKQLPELDDEFAQDVSEYDTLAEYEASIREKIEGAKEQKARVKKEDDIINVIIQNAVIDVPQVMIDEKATEMFDDFRGRVERQGLSFDMYLRVSDKTEDEMMENFKRDAEKQVRASLSLDAIASAEGIEATEEDLLQEAAEMAKYYQVETEQMLETMNEGHKDAIKRDIRTRKAYELVINSAVEA